MKIVVASDKWKGSLSAPDACAAMARGLRATWPAAEILERPIADGGEGTAAVVHRACGGTWHVPVVHGPMGESLEAGYALLPDGTAVIEMAAAAGLVLVDPARLDPRRASTRGVGELMCHAAKQGARRIVVGLGGSATNDGGVGMASALGWHFEGPPFPGGGAMTVSPRPPAGWKAGGPGLEVAGLPHPIEVLAACDVTNPLLGPRGATLVFGPQKGIRPGEIEGYEKALASLAGFFPPELADQPGAGAAGGLGFGLLAFCRARIVSGFGIVAELTRLEEAIAGADLVVTGEGSLDSQTLDGKGPHGVAQLARKHGKRVVGLGGRVLDEARTAFDFTIAATPPAMPLAEAMRRAPELIEAAICQAAPDLLTPRHRPHHFDTR